MLASLNRNSSPRADWPGILRKMKSVLASLLVAASIFVSSAADNIEVFFSPDGGCTEAIIENLNNAKSNVLIQAYSFTSAPIAKAVVDAHKRGVEVKVILDKSQRTAKYSSATFLANAGVPTLIDDNHAIAHNKVIVIDARTVITGSFNFSKAAEESNAENLLVITDRELAAKYVANWLAHEKHSEPYKRVGTK